jgi:hypothetical protein
MKAAQATSSVTVLVSIMIPICLRLMEAFLMRIMTMAAVVVTALGSGGYLPGLARFATLPTARLPVLYRSAGGFPSRILLAPGPGRLDLAKRRHGCWRRFEGELDYLLIDARAAFLAKITLVHPDCGGSSPEAASLSVAWNLIRQRFATRGITLRFRKMDRVLEVTSPRAGVLLQQELTISTDPFTTRSPSTRRTEASPGRRRAAGSTPRPFLPCE